MQKTPSGHLKFITTLMCSNIQDWSEQFALPPFGAAIFVEVTPAMKQGNDWRGLAALAFLPHERSIIFRIDNSILDSKHMR